MTTSPEPNADCDAGGHRPNDDGTCSLLCTCRTPLTRAEVDALHEMGLF